MIRYTVFVDSISISLALFKVASCVVISSDQGKWDSL
jgi:hypothetical protein